MRQRAAIGSAVILSDSQARYPLSQAQLKIPEADQWRRSNDKM